MIKICQYCGKEFEATREERKFCSRKCCEKKKKKWYDHVCEYCGKSFKSKKAGHRFCSKQCANFRRMNRKKVTCSYCGKDIEKRQSLVNKGGNNFCNRECLRKFQSKRNEYVLYDDYAEIVIKTEKHGTFYTKIDLEDVERCRDYTWRISYRKSKWYIGTSKKKPKIRMYLHRFIMNCPDKFEVDHQNGDGFDNRKNNLKIVTHKQNMENIGLNRANKSGVRGVYWSKRDKVWIVQVGHNGKKLTYGRYKDIKDAEKRVIEVRNMLHTNNVTDNNK